MLPPSPKGREEGVNGGEAFTPPENSMETLGSSTMTRQQPQPQHEPQPQEEAVLELKQQKQDRRRSTQQKLSVTMEHEWCANQDGNSTLNAADVSPGADIVFTADPEPRVQADASEADHDGDGGGDGEVVEQDDMTEDTSGLRTIVGEEQAAAFEAHHNDEDEEKVVSRQDDGAGGDASPSTATAKDFAAAAAASTVAAASAAEIRELLSTIPVDLEELRSLAWEPGGYQTDELRTMAWTELLNLDHLADGEDFRTHLETPHSMTDQIQRDVDRSLMHFAHVQRWKRQRQQIKRDKLRDVINAIIRKYDGVLNYYQGYHDVVTTLLLVTEDDTLSYILAERVSIYFFRDCMRADFGVLTYLMHLVPAVIQVFDPELAFFVSKSKVEPYYCMAWVLTWFAHDLSELNVVARLYDVLISGHPALILYMCAAVTMSAREDVLACECEFSAVHNTLARAAKRVTDWEVVLQKTKGMFRKCPPGELLLRAPAYIRETLGAGGVTSFVFPPPWFTGLSLADWILVEQTREEGGKRRITKAAGQWHQAVRLAGGENPEDMLAAYLEGGSGGRPGNVLKEILKRVMSRVRLRSKKWKIAASPRAALISTAVLIGAVAYSYHLSSQQQIGSFP